MSFSSGGKRVLIGGAEVRANLQLVSDTGYGAYLASLPHQDPGTSYVVTYTRAGTTTSISVPVPPRPEIRSEAIVRRSANFVLTYTRGSGTSVSGTASDKTSNIDGEDQPDDGTFENLDVSGFSPGPGSVSITRHLEFPVSGTGFHSVKVKYDVITDKPVTWS